MNDAGKAAERRTLHLRMTGRVPGVCYRAWPVELAETLELDGWVRNRRDGSVEALISGSGDAVARMVRSFQQGPLGAQVAKVEIIQEGGTAPSGFAVLPTS